MDTKRQWLSSPILDAQVTTERLISSPQADGQRGAEMFEQVLPEAVSVSTP
jgi:hypothetical protein